MKRRNQVHQNQNLITIHHHPNPNQHLQFNLNLSNVSIQISITVSFHFSFHFSFQSHQLINQSITQSDECNNNESSFEVKTTLKNEDVKILFSSTSPGFSLSTQNEKDPRVNVSFCPLREIDESGRIIQQQSLQSSKLTYSHKYEQSSQNITMTYSTTLSNGAFIQIIQTIFLKKSLLRFEEEKVKIEMKPNSIKYSYFIKEWPFKKSTNQMELCTSQSISEELKCSKQHQSQKRKSERNRKIFERIKTIKD